MCVCEREREREREERADLAGVNARGPKAWYSTILMTAVRLY